MNNKLHIVLIVLIGVTLALQACSEYPQPQISPATPGIQQGLTTTTLITLSDTYPYLDDYRDYYGVWEIHFESEHHFRANLNNQLVVSGLYLLSENEIQIFDREGFYACLPENSEMGGHYWWGISDTGLELAVIDDVCVWRSLVFTKHPLTFV